VGLCSKEWYCVEKSGTDVGWRNDDREKKMNLQEFLNSLLVDGRVDHLQVINQRIVRVFLKEVLVFFFLTAHLQVISQCRSILTHLQYPRVLLHTSKYSTLVDFHTPPSHQPAYCARLPHGGASLFFFLLLPFFFYCLFFFAVSACSSRRY
jgi:hypothetical protein